MTQTFEVCLGVEPEGGERVLIPMRNEHLWFDYDRVYVEEIRLT